jgi:uncharacterized protein involved in outer membrane biogenesis
MKPARPASQPFVLSPSKREQPKSPRLPSALSRGARIAIAFALVLVALVLAFDWNWFRGPLERYLARSSGREVKIGELHVRPSLEPTIRLRDVRIENAPWAAARPFAIAGEISFSVSLKSLWKKRPVVSRLVLLDADIDMERQADGLRNWRLTHPDDRSVGRVRVQTLEAHGSKIRFVNRAIDLDFVATASPAETAQRKTNAAESAANELSTRIEYQGKYQGASFTGSALSTGVVSFRDSGFAFPLRGHFASGKTRLEFDGSFTDIFDLGPMNAKLRLSGPSLEYVHPFLPIHPPPSRAFELEAHLRQTESIYRFEQLRGRVGRTELAGEATYDRSKERRLVIANLQSAAAELPDLAVLVGLRYPQHSSGSRKIQDENAGDEGKRGAGNRDTAARRVFSERAFHLDKLRSVDARVTLEARKLTADNIPMLDSVRLNAQLEDGALDVKRLDIGVAGGHASGALSYNGREAPHAFRSRLELRDLRLQRLVPKLAANAQAFAPVHGEIAITSRGNSLAMIAAHASGSAAVRVSRGQLSNIADAKLGLNFGKMLSLMIRGDREVPINCGVASFDLRDGLGRSRAIVLDTEQTRTVGVATIDARAEKWQLLLTPQPKNPGLFTRHASIRVDGTFRQAKISIQERIALRGSNDRTDSSTSSSECGGDKSGVEAKRREDGASRQAQR